jgi:hypothetical protein
VLPIVAENRAAFSNWCLQSVWVGSLFMGIIIGCCASYSFLRFFEKIPAKGPILKSVILSFIVLVVVTLLVGGPSNFLATGDVLRYFLISTIINVIRILALGIGIGYLYKRLNGEARS